MADIDWDAMVKAAEEGGFTAPAPLGTYTVRVESAEAGESSRKKTPQIALKLKITEGPHAGKRPTTFAHTFYRTEASAGMFMGNLNAFGITGQILVQHRPTLDQIARVLVGKTAVITTRNATGEYALMNDGSNKIEAMGTLKAPASGAVEVTSFPPVSMNAAPAGGFATDPGF